MRLDQFLAAVPQNLGVMISRGDITGEDGRPAWSAWLFPWGDPDTEIVHAEAWTPEQVLVDLLAEYREKVAS